jgi:predicted adenylyl cyclase CyaB
MTIKETADLLKVHWQTVRKYIKQGKIPSTKIGRNIRMRESDVRTFAAGKKVKPVMEIEIRFECKNRSVIEKYLLEHGAKVSYHSHIVDHYFIPKNINSQEEKNEWYDSGRGHGLRVREQDNDYSGNVSTTLEVKRLTEALNHNTTIESEVDVPDYEQVRDLLSLMEMKEFMVIDKDRVMYKYKEAKICFDDIKDFKVGVEIEIKSDQSRDEVLPVLRKIATEIGLDLKDEIEKSLTFLAMEKLATF